MRFLRKQEYAGAPKWLLLFLIGFIMGIVVLNAGVDYFLQNSGLLDEYTLGRLKYMEINYNTFFIYVLKKRFCVLWLLVILSSTFFGIFVLYGYVLWIGFSGGVLLSAAIVRYGMKGIVFMSAAALPQFILYVPACILLLNLGYQICVKLYFPGRDIGQFGQHKRQMLLQWLFLFLGIHLVVIIGVLLESYVNPIIITKILNFF